LNSRSSRWRRSERRGRLAEPLEQACLIRGRQRIDVTHDERARMDRRKLQRQAPTLPHDQLPQVRLQQEQRRSSIRPVLR
jgi:hypothetical protein